ncbi:MAG: alpha/beta fold hydrolase [Calditrichia bacterium]
MVYFNESLAAQVFCPEIPVIFLHAFPLNHSMWEPQMASLEEKGVGYLAPDFPGFGASKVSPITYQMSDYAELVNRLLSELGIRKAIVVGLSMGGYVALALYRNHPEIFAGLMLANTRASADSPETRERRMDMIKSLQTTGDLNPIIDSHIPKFFTEITRKNKQDLVEQIIFQMQKSSVDGVIQALLAMADRADSRPILPTINFPVTVVTGDADPLTGIEDAQDMVSRIPGAELVIIREAAHLSNIEQPRQFNSALENLLTKVKKQN